MPAGRPGARLNVVQEPSASAAAPESSDGAGAKRVLFVLGGPASGKGTQCEVLKDSFGFVHLSAGELLRRERANPSGEWGAVIDECMSEGKLVPVEVSLGLIRDEIERSNAHRFLVDGFPRNWDNVHGWERHMKDIAVDGVLFLDVPEEILEARLMERSATSGRADDNLETARKRFRTYADATLPVVDYYREKGLLLDVKGTGGVAEVSALVGAEVERVLKSELVEMALGGAAREPDAGDAASSGALKDQRVASCEIHGRTAVVRVEASVARPGGSDVDVEESQTWAFQQGQWHCVHVHRSRR